MKHVGLHNAILARANDIITNSWCRPKTVYVIIETGHRIRITKHPVGTEKQKILPAQTDGESWNIKVSDMSGIHGGQLPITKGNKDNEGEIKGEEIVARFEDLIGYLQAFWMSGTHRQQQVKTK